MQRNSTVSRLASLWVNFDFFLASPVFGNGITYVEKTAPLITLSRYGIYYGSNTNTIMLTLANFGILYFVPWIVGIFRFFRAIGGGTIGTLLLFASFVLSSSSENFNHIIFFYVFFFYGMSMSNGKNVVYNSR